MAGILNKKQRIMDVIITQNGRRQLRNGTFNVKYISYSDRDIEYISDDGKTAADVSNHISFEAFSNVYDTIIPEIDNIDGTISYEQTSNFIIKNGFLLKQTEDGNFPVTGSGDLYDASEEIFSKSLDAFYKLDALGVDDELSGIGEFAIETNGNRYTPAVVSPLEEVDVFNAPGLLNDNKFRNSLTHAYMPPVFKASNGSMQSFGKFKNLLSQNKDLDFDDFYEKEKLAEKNFTAVKITNNTNYNDLLGQVFEIDTQNNELNKLVLLEVGSFGDPYGNPTHKIYYAGKLLYDNRGYQKFIRIFTIIFEK